MAYRTDFFISFVIMLLTELISPLVTLLIYSNGGHFPGYTIYEALVVQGVFLLSRGIAFPLFYGIVWNTIGAVQSGDFDFYLLRPHSILINIISSSFDAEDLGKLLGGIMLFAFSAINVSPGRLHWLGFLFLFIASLVIQFAFALFMAGLGIIWVGNSRIYEIYSTATNFGMYPHVIFSKTAMTILTAAIPIAFIGTIPAAVLLGKSIDYLPAGIISCVIFTILGSLFFSRMVKRYSSAGG
jgi:ABC-2 type transport system permease protein